MNDCDTCAYYAYDEDWECYTCMVNMDEDDYARFMSGGAKECPTTRTTTNTKL